jgi:hypothetical protein
MSTAQFQVAYDGEAVRTGAMEIYDLAQALLAVADLVTEASHVVNGETVSPSIQVESNFKAGSFEVAVLLNQEISERDFVDKGYPILDAEAIIEGLFGGTTGPAAINGVIKIFRALKGEKPKSRGITVINDYGIIETESGNYAENVDITSARLYQDETIRYHTLRFLASLRNPGIETIEIRKRGQILEAVTKDEAAVFLRQEHLSTGAERPRTSRRETVLRIVRVSFKSGNKYQVSEGPSEFSVAIEDQSFLNQVQRDEISFTAHGRMDVLLRQELIPGATKDEIRYAVERVYRYVPAPRPISLE